MMPATIASAPVRSRRSRPPSIRAFTLVEILVVLAILGLLVGLTVEKLGKSFDNAKVQAAQIFVAESMKTPLFTYKMQMGDYPSTEEGLQALLTAPANKADKWQGPYIEVQGGRLPVDPWKNPYQYRYPGAHNKDGYDLWSMGPDGKDGTDDDIGNW
jgi:general secretion pathway protein G